MMNSAEQHPVPDRRDIDVGAVLEVPAELIHQQDPNGAGEDDAGEGEPEQPLDANRGALLDSALETAQSASSATTGNAAARPARAPRAAR